MGLEHLEIGICLERVFHLEMDGDFWEVVFSENPPHAQDVSRSPAGTVGRVYEELLKRLTASGQLGSDSSEWTTDTVWTLTRSIISDRLSAPMEQVTPAAHLIRDLGMG